MPALSGQARLAGVIGWPVGHSRSPRLHNHWLARHGIDGAYLPLPVRPGCLPEALAGLRACGFAGVNVTLPHKEAAFAACDAPDESARRSGAVNTIVFEDGRMSGRNTDGAGFLASLRAEAIDPAAGPALVLGAGGSARAVAAALLDAGAAVAVANRHRPRAEALAAALPGLRVVAWERREAALADCALAVNATPCGMRGGAMADVAPLAPDALGANPRLAVADLVYVPLETPLLRHARAAGLRTVGGLGMLLHQAVPGFAAWFGVVPVVDAETVSLVAADIPRV